MRHLFGVFARNTVFVNVGMVLLFIAGAVAVGNLVRELWPNFHVDMVAITVPYPGADPEEVEEAISRKIEEAIIGLEGIRRVDTLSFENQSRTHIELLKGYDIKEVKEEIKTRVDAISTFPPDAESPVVTEITLNTEVINLNLTGAYDIRRLQEWAHEIKDEVRELPGVSRVDIHGIRDYEISIEVSEEKLRQYDLSFDEVTAVVRASSQNLAGGTVRTKDEEIRLRTLGRKYYGDEFRKIVLRSSPRGELITLGQVAEVRDGYAEDQPYGYLNGEPTVMLFVRKTDQEDAIRIADIIREYIDQKQETLPGDLKLTWWNDTSYMVRGALSLLSRNAVAGLFLVFLLLWFFLDLRLSFWASMGIPISLSGALAVLWLIGSSLNIVSLFSLIMVVGIIVDDAIVVGESIYVHRQRGKGQLESAVDGVSEVGMPVIGAVLTTMVAFLPLLFVGGLLGKFVRILPIAVIIALAISTFECLFMLPAHLSHLPDPNEPKQRKRQDRGLGRRMRLGIAGGLDRFVQRVYLPLARYSVRNRYATLMVSVGMILVGMGLQMGGFVQFVMFPRMDENIITMTLEFPEGAPLATTKAAVQRSVEAIRRVEAQTETGTGEPLIQHLYEIVGGELKPPDPARGPRTGSHLGNVRVQMIESEIREVPSRVVRTAWEKELGHIPGLSAMTIYGEGSGPPGRPIEVWLLGNDLDKLVAASEELAEELEGFQGVSQVVSDWQPGKSEIRFRLKPAARSLGLTVADLARQVYAGFYGEEAIRIQRGRDDIRVRVRYTEEERVKMSTLENMRIRTPLGSEVPLHAVAEVSYGPGYSTILRTDGKRRIGVSAEVDTAVANTVEITAALESSFLRELPARYPGITYSVQGETQKTSESLGSLAVGFPLALVFIYFIIATIFRSYLQPFIIMFTVPFGVIGALAGHYIMGSPVTMFSVFGMVALAGVVVNDAIVFIECVNGFISRGTPFFESVINAGERRFRAIFLTTISTCGGLLPMLLAQGRQAEFVIPMAISITFGVAFATIITLFLIPSALAILNDLRRFTTWSFTGTMPSSEDVEPATARHKNPLKPKTAEEVAAPVES